MALYFGMARWLTACTQMVGWPILSKGFMATKAMWHIASRRESLSPSFANLVMHSLVHSLGQSHHLAAGAAAQPMGSNGEPLLLSHPAGDAWAVHLQALWHGNIPPCGHRSHMAHGLQEEASCSLSCLPSDTLPGVFANM